MPKYASAAEIGKCIEKEMPHLKYRYFEEKRIFNIAMHHGSFRNVADFCQEMLNVDVFGMIWSPTLNELEFEPMFDLSKHYDVYITEADALGNYYFEIFESVQKRSSRLQSQKIQALAAREEGSPWYFASFGMA
jgi:hypothetical protein